MKAAVFHGPYDVRIEEVAKPVPGPGEVVCKVAAAGICGTDLEIYHGVMPYLKDGRLSFPWTPGHEWSGVVESVGEGVTDFQPGDRVVGEVSISCDVCDACRQGYYNLCANRTEVGITGRFPGAFAECIRIPARHTFHVPDTVSLREAAMCEPSGIAMHGMDHLGIGPGEKVVVMGDGSIGLMAAQIALASGAAPLVLLGSHGSKMDIARQVGIQHTVSRHAPDAREQILAALGGTRADYLVEATGNPSALDFAASVVRIGGKVVNLSVYPVDEVTFHANNFVGNEIHILASLSSVNCYPRVLRMMESGQIQVLPLLGPSYPFARVAEAFANVAHKRTSGVKTLVVHEGVLD